MQAACVRRVRAASDSEDETLPVLCESSSQRLSTGGYLEGDLDASSGEEDEADAEEEARAAGGVTASDAAREEDAALLTRLAALYSDARVAATAAPAWCGPPPLPDPSSLSPARRSALDAFLTAATRDFLPRVAAAAAVEDAAAAAAPGGEASYARHLPAPAEEGEEGEGGNDTDSEAGGLECRPALYDPDADERDEVARRAMEHAVGGGGASIVGALSCPCCFAVLVYAGALPDASAGADDSQYVVRASSCHMVTPAFRAQDDDGESDGESDGEGDGESDGEGDGEGGNGDGRQGGGRVPSLRIVLEERESGETLAIKGDGMGGTLFSSTRLSGKRRAGELEAGGGTLFHPVECTACGARVGGTRSSGRRGGEGVLILRGCLPSE